MKTPNLKKLLVLACPDCGKKNVTPMRDASNLPKEYNWAKCLDNVSIDTEYRQS